MARHGQQRQQQVVVVTGASGGIGRATAIAFGARGATVALLARGEEGLEGAAKEVEAAGGRALVVPVDVADADAVERAAATVSRSELGPIDVWVNVAFTSVFAPFWEIEPEGVRAASPRSATSATSTARWPPCRGCAAQPRDDRPGRLGPRLPGHPAADRLLRGQARDPGLPRGAALRAAARGAAASHVTMVQMPAVNTPQFSWVLSRLPHQAQPVPPIYQPEVAATGGPVRRRPPAAPRVLGRWQHVGTLAANAIAPGLLDRYLARTGFSAQQTDQPQDPDQPANLWEPADAGRPGLRRPRALRRPVARPRSLQLWASQHHGLLGAAAGAAAAGTVVLARALRR